MSSPLDVLRDKRSFIPEGFRDEDGVWHNGPHLDEYDAALAAVEQLVEAMVAIAYAQEYDANGNEYFVHRKRSRELALAALARFQSPADTKEDA